MRCISEVQLRRELRVVNALDHFASIHVATALLYKCLLRQNDSHACIREKRAEYL